MTTNEIGQEEGEVCNRSKCQGVIAVKDTDGSCYCHISPPCGICATPREYCPVCDWDALEEFRSVEESQAISFKSVTLSPVLYKPRILDPTKIDYFVKGHTHFSQICEGVYPAGVTPEDVLKEVRGTFGGRFEHFGSGRFKYIAYTD